VGWALGDGKEHGEDSQWDAAEADALYTKLEQEIIPVFYNRDAHGLPVAWIERVRESMARLTPQYSADRSVREYTEKYYLQAASLYHERVKEDGDTAARIVRWRQTVAEHWHTAHFGPSTVQTDDSHHHFQLQIHLGDLSPEFVQVELYANALPGGSPERHVMTRETGQEQASIDGCMYSARVPVARPAFDYTPRLIPHNEEAIVPLEAFQILWQR
jgi:starch phosphorylase